MPTQITLRKAARLRSQIDTRLNEIHSEFSAAQVSVNIYDPKPLTQIASHAEKYETAYARYRTLAAVLYELRARIGTANETAGIPRLLSALSFKNLLLKQIRPAVGAAPRIEDEQIEARINGERETASSGRAGRYAQAELTFEALTQDTIASFKTEDRAFRNEIVSLTDRLEALNNTSVVEISDEMASVLKVEGILF